jgi:hypothetical protein
MNFINLHSYQNSQKNLFMREVSFLYVKYHKYILSKQLSLEFHVNILYFCLQETLDALPAEVICNIRQRRRFKEMRKEIEDFLLWCSYIMHQTV